VGPPLWGVGPLVGDVQITFYLCSVLYCLPARWRCPRMKGCRHPGDRRHPERFHVAQPGEGGRPRMEAGQEPCHLADPWAYPRGT